MLTKIEIAIIAGFTSAAVSGMVECMDSAQVLSFCSGVFNTAMSQLFGRW